MRNAPNIAIDVPIFRADPYPTLERLRQDAPVAFLPPFRSAALVTRDDVVAALQNPNVFSSTHPGQLMETLMGVNMMRKDGEAHAIERRAIARSISPKAAQGTWLALFRAHAERIIGSLEPGAPLDLFADVAAPLSAECLKSVTGLVDMPWRVMDASSQAMMDGIINHAGDPAVQARCEAATAAIDAAIDARVPALRAAPDESLLSALVTAGLPMEQVRADIKLAISGGQNEPRDAIAGAAWALLTHPAQLELVRSGRVPWLQVFHEYVRWISPIGMVPRRVAKRWTVRDVELEVDDRVLLFLSSANRDEAHFAHPERFDVTRDTSKQIAFGGGAHFCAGAWISRTVVAQVALPMLFERLADLRLADDPPVHFSGWTFRGPLNLPVTWSTTRH